METTTKSQKVINMFQRLVCRLDYSRAKAIKVIARETGLEIATIAYIVSVACSGLGVDNQ